MTLLAAYGMDLYNTKTDEAHIQFLHKYQKTNQHFSHIKMILWNHLELIVDRLETTMILKILYIHQLQNSPMTLSPMTLVTHHI